MYMRIKMQNKSVGTQCKKFQKSTVYAAIAVSKRKQLLGTNFSVKTGEI